MKPTPHPDSHDDAGRRAELLSALADGEGDAGLAGECSALWRSDPESRRTWHAYHLIGDVLRSDELSGSSARDESFLLALRERLKDEPVILAPEPSVPARPVRERRWVAGAAVAAGFAALTGAALIGQAPPPEVGIASTLAVVPQGVEARRVATVVAASAPQTLVIDGNVIRDARLDAYFDAHRGAVGAMPSALPGGALRSVDILLPQR